MHCSSHNHCVIQLLIHLIFLQGKKHISSCNDCTLILVLCVIARNTVHTLLRGTNCKKRNIPPAGEKPRKDEHTVLVPRSQSGAVPKSSLLGVGSWGYGKLERVGQLGEGWGK